MRKGGSETLAQSCLNGCLSPLLGNQGLSAVKHNDCLGKAALSNGSNTND